MLARVRLIGLILICLGLGIIFGMFMSNPFVQSLVAIILIVVGIVLIRRANEREEELRRRKQCVNPCPPCYRENR